METPVMRTELLKVLVEPDRLVSSVEIQEIVMSPGARAPLHFHPCPTVGVITEGAVTFQIEGEAEQYLKAGDPFYEPPGVRVAKFDNEGELPARFVVFYLLGTNEKETVRIVRE